jgi:hypothetical protein
VAPGPARLAGWICIATALGLLTPAAAPAERAAGIAGNLNLVRLDTATPGEVSLRPITGLKTAGETAVGIDTRPATGELFLVTTPDNVIGGATVITRTYRLDPETAVATFVGELTGGSPPLAGDWNSGIDFNPVVDRLRVVSANKVNYRLVPDLGTMPGNAADTDLSFTPPSTGQVTAIANDRNIAPGPPGTTAPPGSRTTVYGIDVGSDRLVTVGSVDGTPAGPNGGALTAVGGNGALGVAVDNASDAGFDISPGGGAYASLRTAGISSLYTVNLATGAVTPIGLLPLELRSLTILPPVTPPPVEPAPLGPDTAAPVITLHRVPSRLTVKRFLRGVVARVTSTEPVSLEIALLGRARTASIARAGDLVLAERSVGISAAARRVRLKPSRRLVARTRRFTVRLRVVATDAAGNRTAAVKRIRVGPRR